jgi:methyl-accepting chemotaxis protein
MQAAVAGRNKVNETVQNMQHLKEQSHTTSEIVKELNQYSQQIGQIIDTITAIAGQTNLLALNAAIEAARAGEQGRGFAVVAEEVRKLAEQSNQGAQEITALVQKVAEKTENTVRAMSQNGQEVERGFTTVNEAGNALDHILQAVEKTVAEVKGITDVTTEEVANSGQIVGLINKVASMVETMAANAQQVSTASEVQSAAMQTVAASAEETSAMANQLKTSVERFQLD